MTLGLSEQDLQIISNVCRRFPKIESVVLFGSRAMGNFKKGSDVDLALTGKIDHAMLNQLKSVLENDCPVPYFFDIIDYASIENKDLKAHIDQYGKVIYRRSKNQAIPIF